MHSIQRTKAVVLNSFPFGESDKQLLLLTEKYGMIRVRAQGIRKEKSKLKQSIQEYSFCEVSLVHGKAGWRLTNALFEFNILFEVQNSDVKVAIVRVLDLVSKLVIDQAEDDEIYSIVDQFISLALDKEGIDSKQYETVFLLNILGKLGYVDMNPFIDILNSNSFEGVKEEQIKKMTVVINQGIRESGLLK